MQEDSNCEQLWDAGHTLLETRHEDEALVLFARLAELGDWRGAYMAGWVHESRGVRMHADRTQKQAQAEEAVTTTAAHRQHYITAAHWFERALSLQDNHPAHMGLARYHYFGLGGRQDCRAAFAHLVQVLPDNDPVAQIMLAELLYRGLGTARDPLRAQGLLLTAAAAGYPAAWLSLMQLARGERRWGRMLHHGARAVFQWLRLRWQKPGDPRLIGVGGRYGSFIRVVSRRRH